MKKFVALTLCVAVAGSMMAQKQTVEQAKKLTGKFEKLDEARGLIQQAMQNPETSQDPNTYFVAGDLEFSAFDNGIKKGMIKPDDPSADPIALGYELLNGYKYFLQALPYDSLPDAKGQIKPKFTSKIASKIGSHANEFFTAGGNFYNAQKVYPEAYQAFMIYGDLPEQDFFGSKAPEIDPTNRSTAYFNAGLASYFGNSLLESAEAFRKAREAGYPDPEDGNKGQAYIYEIACWQHLQNDSTLADTAKAKILDVSRAGFQKYGLEIPLFLNNLVNYMISDGQFAQALSLIDEQLAQNSSNPNLVGLRAFVLDRKGEDAESVEEYRKAATLPDVDFETLKNAAKKIYRTGAEKWNLIEGNSPEAQAARQDVKVNYFEAAKKITDKAKAMNGGDSDLDYVIENIDYALETYFK